MTPQPRRRRLEVEDIGDITVVNFVDKKILDEQNIQVIGEQLFSLVDELGRRKVLLNFGNVEFLSSAALGKLITLNRKLQGAGGKLVLTNIDPQIYEVFEITDEGPGFDPEDVPDPTAPENLERPCGRGLLLMRHYMTEVAYHDRGRAVRMAKVRKGA